MKIFYFLCLIFISNSFSQASPTLNDGAVKTNLSDFYESDLTSIGPTSLNDRQLDSAKITGPLQFNNLVIDKTLHVVGPVNGSYGKFNELIVIGPLTLLESEVEELNIIGHTKLENVKVNLKVDVVGYIEAYESMFPDITITSNEAKLYNSTVYNILVKIADKKSSSKEQVLELKGKTIINGDIIFESERGKILLSKDSKINGQVYGGIIHQPNR